MDRQNGLSGRLKQCLDLCCDNLSANTRMLNIGCHNGSLENHLSMLYKNTVFHACEIDSAKLKERQRGTDNIYYTVSSALDLPYSTNEFEIVTSFDVIEHIPKSSEHIMLHEVRRVLKLGGILLLSTPRKSVINNLTDPAWYFGHRHYSKNEIKTFLQSTGFEMIKYEVHGGVCEMLDMWILYIAKWIFKSKVPLWIMKLLSLRADYKKVKRGGL
jgi:2-polyprenyl-3-methyl-5-hydroxy-6-metoxy-1,4-benzoquinol methylase